MMARLSGGTWRKFDTDQPSAARQTMRNKNRNASLADCAQAPAGSAPSLASGMVIVVIVIPPGWGHGEALVWVSGGGRPGPGPWAEPPWRPKPRRAPVHRPAP